MLNTPYTLPDIYEVAFSFRNYPNAVDFLIESAQITGGSEIKKMVELGCGPGQYCREFAKRGIKATGLDLSPEMVHYLKTIAEEEKLPLTAIEGDMRSFSLTERVDLAVCMMDTPSLLLTNKDMIGHLNAVAKNLNDDGIYIMELAHPRAFYTTESLTSNNWTIESNSITVHTNWATESTVDPLTETKSGIVTYTVEQHGKTEEYKSNSCWRMYSAGLMRALIELSGQFKITMMYGDLDVNIPFDNDKKAWRMILVLRKYV